MNSDSVEVITSYGISGYVNIYRRCSSRVNIDSKSVRGVACKSVVAGISDYVISDIEVSGGRR